MKSIVVSLKGMVVFVVFLLFSNLCNAQLSGQGSKLGLNQKEFSKLKDEFRAFNDSLNRIENPSAATIDSLIAKYQELLAFNRSYLEKSFTQGTSQKGKREAFFDFICFAIDSAHCGLSFKEKYYGFNWDSIVQYYRDQQITTKNNEVFLFYCDEMLSVLNDGHTWASHDKSTHIQSLGIDFSCNEEQFIVNGFYEGVNSGRLNLGDEIVTIDGEPFHDIYERVRSMTIFKHYPKMDDLYRKRFFRSYYFYERSKSLPDSVSFVLRKPDGCEYSLRLRWYPARYVRNMYGVRVQRAKKVGMTSKILENNIGYIKIDKWNPDFIGRFNAIFAEMNNTNGIILDIRNNFGGDFTNFGQTVLSKFLPRDTITMYKQFKNSNLYHRYGFAGLHYQEDESSDKVFYPMTPVRLMKSGDTVYGNPVVLLVNQKHFSSTDLFIMAFHELEIGTIVGRLNSFQLLGQPIHIKTPWNDWQCGLSVMIPYSMHKRLYEEVIIKPDIEVPLTKSEIKREEDPILTSAIDYLNSIAN